MKKLKNYYIIAKEGSGKIMNFYDKVHELVRAFKATDEYLKYIDVKSSVKSNEQLYKALQEFKEEQRKTQMEYISTNKMNEESQLKLQKSYEELIKNEDVRKLFEYEIKLDVLLADMQKIIGEGIKELIEF